MLTSPLAASLESVRLPRRSAGGKKLSACYTACPWRLPTALVAVALTLATLTAAGCGAGASSPAPPVTVGDTFVPGLSGDTQPDPSDASFSKRVVLDWTGGSPAFLDYDVAATDFGMMHAADGEPLDSEVEALQESVRQHMEGILSAIQPARFSIVTGEAEDHPGATAVYLTGDVGAGGAGQAGQTRLDQCDLDQGGDIVVWGGSLLSLGDGFELSEWAHVFANVAAHEVGHTVGFFHPDAYLTDISDYEWDKEIMMSLRTLTSLRGPQAFLIPQETCPSDIAQKYGGVAYELPADSRSRPAARLALTSSRATCVCEVVADE